MLALCALTLFCVPVHLASRLLLRRSDWPRRFLGTTGRLFGMDACISGQLLRHDVFYVANHVSWVDILVLGGASGCAFVSKDDVGQWPLVGWLAAQNNTILVSRGDRAGIHAQIEAVRAAMAEHQPIALFPEGTTGDGHHLLPFKPSLFAVLLPPPRAIRVQPIFIDYGDGTGEMGWSGAEPAFANASRILGRRERTTVTLHCLEPFDPGEHPDRKLLAAQTRARIEAAMLSLRGAKPAV